MSIKSYKIEHWKLIALVLCCFDIVSIAASYFLAIWIRFDCKFSEIYKYPYYVKGYEYSILFYCVFCVVVFYLLKLYNRVWRFASYAELESSVVATFISSVSYFIVMMLVYRMPISYHLMGTCFQGIFLISSRFGQRFILMFKSRNQRDGIVGKRAMLIGAGSTGQMILRDSMLHPENEAKICCIIDDDENKHNRFMEGIPIVGGREDILANVEKYDIEQILIALPHIVGEERREILNICQESGCELKTLPGMYQMVNGDVSINQMKPVAVEDLLGRETIKVNMDEIFNYLTGKVILITGGGGSIGSELCRQVAGHKPKQLIVFDVYENNAYSIEQELKADFPELNLVTLIGSVRDSRRIESVFEKYRPDVVYHAAAHKHVPLMETSPCESIKNNVIGTYKTAYAAMKYGCKRFVLISTDKAVNPTNIMGASKRLCEMVIQSLDYICKNSRFDLLPCLDSHEKFGEVKEEKISEAKTEFVAVRFGNVLGSNGSVIPLFKKQIEKGGPVTVTHPDIIRYFMTIPEAVSLVLQAGCYAKGGEIFVLDMGEPMKIDTLARNLIRLSGFKPDEDIKIVYTGLRPGEKLYEEKLMAEEGLERTENELIHVGKPVHFDMNDFMSQLVDLAAASYTNDETIKECVQKIVTTYKYEV